MSFFNALIFPYDREDPTIPTRPPGQRPAPLRDPNSSFFGAPMRGATYSSGNFAISAGFGVFPGLFGVTIVSWSFKFASNVYAYTHHLYF